VVNFSSQRFDFAIAGAKRDHATEKLSGISRYWSHRFRTRLIDQSVHDCDGAFRCAVVQHKQKSSPPQRATNHLHAVLLQNGGAITFNTSISHCMAIASFTILKWSIFKQH